MQIMISGGYKTANPRIYKEIDIKQKIAFIPSWFGNDSREDFKRFKMKFKNASVGFYPLDKIDKDKIKKLFESDVIYIEGGNTYVLLHYIKTLKLHKKFEKFVKTNTLIGMSAGAIIQTPNINLAGIPYFNADENLVNLKNKSALGLVSFEVFPHFDMKDRKELKELKKYSKNRTRRIYLIPDGTHIKIDNKILSVVGKHWILRNGELCTK